MGKILRIIALAMMAAPFAYGAYALATPAHADPLRDRAQKIFVFDETHPHELPGHHVRALSMAVAFHDEQGMRELTEGLEKIIASRGASTLPQGR